MPDRPNVLFIIADQWRGDCLGCAGHPDVKTPYFDTLAARGFRFAHAYTATPTCIPARAALYTGMAQEHHRRVGYQDGVRWDYPNTLAGSFADAGYQCHCAGKLHVHPLRNSVGYHSVDLHDGFLHYYRRPTCTYEEDQRNADDYYHWLKEQLGAAADPTETGIECNSWVARPWMYDEKYHPTRWATDRAIDFLRKRDRDKPFFLTVSYVRPHAPFDAPEAFWSLYRGQTLRPPKKGDWEDETRYEKGGRIVDSETGPVDPALQSLAQMGYYAAITQIDYELGRLNDALYSHGLLENTVICFVSDHGEMLCDHGYFRKSLPFEGSAQVPMIFSAPPSALQAAGYAPNAPVAGRLAELRDVMPTLLSLCGLPVPDTVDGVNLFGEGYDRDYIHGEHLYDGGSCQWIVTDHDKFVWFSHDDRKLYFDLDADPDENHNAIEDERCRSRAAALEALLVGELAWREEGFVQEGRLTPGVACKAVLSAGKPRA